MDIVKRIYCKWEHCKKRTQEKGNITKREQIYEKGTKRKREQNEMGTNMNIVKRIYCKWEHCKKGTQEKGNIANWEQRKRETLQIGNRGKGKCI